MLDLADRAQAVVGQLHVIAAAQEQVCRRHRLAQEAAAAEEEAAPAGAPAPAPRLFVLAASGIVGFAFFLLELVWYRMLGPLLGGSSYTFGLILVIALLVT